MVGMSWIEIPAGKYKLVPPQARKSTCQIELTVGYSHFFDSFILLKASRFDALIPHPPEGEWQKIAPLRILSFDIECAGRKGVFPEANVDPVIQIANMVTRQGVHTSPHYGDLTDVHGRRRATFHSQHFHAEFLRPHRRFASFVL